MKEPDGGYTCKKCSRWFSRHATYLAHMADVHGPGMPVKKEVPHRAAA